MIRGLKSLLGRAVRARALWVDAELVGHCAWCWGDVRRIDGEVSHGPVPCWTWLEGRHCWTPERGRGPRVCETRPPEGQAAAGQEDGMATSGRPRS